jgi:hypothetical protein
VGIEIVGDSGAAQQLCATERSARDRDAQETLTGVIRAGESSNCLAGKIEAIDLARLLAAARSI